MLFRSNRVDRIIIKIDSSGDVEMHALRCQERLKLVHEAIINRES